MEDGHGPADEVASVNERLLEWRQGDVAAAGVSLTVARTDLPLATLSRELAGEQAVEYFVAEQPTRVVLLTQTCDVVRPVVVGDEGGRFWVQVAPVVQLTESTAALARKGRIPRFAAIPGGVEGEFADLDRCTTLEKSVLAEMTRVDASPDNRERAAFGEALARNRGRFAFPDDLEGTLSPFKSLMVKRAGKNSCEGRCLDAVVQIRAEPDPSWDDEQVAVTVYFIVEAGQLPATDEEAAVFAPVDMAAVEAMDDSAKIAEMIEQSSPHDVSRRHALWSRLADLWIAGCTPTGSISYLCALVESEADFSLIRMRVAPQIDFDHLSPGDDPIK